MKIRDILNKVGLVMILLFWLSPFLMFFIYPDRDAEQRELLALFVGSLFISSVLSWSFICIGHPNAQEYIGGKVAQILDYEIPIGGNKKSKSQFDELLYQLADASKDSNKKEEQRIITELEILGYFKDQ